MVQEQGFCFGITRLRQVDQALKLGVGSNRHRVAFSAEFPGVEPHHTPQNGLPGLCEGDTEKRPKISFWHEWAGEIALASWSGRFRSALLANAASLNE
jgi:hypothetical protein